MNFKKYYINGGFGVKFSYTTAKFPQKTRTFKLGVAEWNNLMLWLTNKTTFNRRYTVDYYPYSESILEKIESWYEKPKFFFRKPKQLTRSTFVNGKNKKEIKVKHFKELYK
jgi:hypothetical protein